MKSSIILALLGMTVSGLKIKNNQLASRAGEIAPIEHNNIQLYGRLNVNAYADTDEVADADADADIDEEEGEPCEPALDVSEKELYI